MKILLASNSPRRKELLKELGFDFEIVSVDCDEVYPTDLAVEKIAAYLSELKSNAFRTLNPGEVLNVTKTFWEDPSGLYGNHAENFNPNHYQN